MKSFKFVAISGLILQLLGPVAHAQTPGVEVVELQASLCGEPPVSMLRRLETVLGGAVTEHEVRQTYFLESSKRLLEKSGIVIRYRVSSKGVHSAVKASYSVLSGVPPDISGKFAKGCEVDAYFGQSKIGCKVKEKHKKLGELSGRQRHFLELAKIESRLWLEAGLLGPVKNEATQISIEKAVYTLESTELPDATHLTELSIRVPVADAAVAQASFYSLTQRAGLTLCPDQSGVTKKILDQLLRAVKK